MNFTRQDLQKISAYLSKQSVKDSQFEKVDSISSDTSIPVLQTGQNKLSTVSQLASYIQQSFSLYNVPVSIDGLTSTNLFEALGEIYGIAKTKVTPQGNVLNAENVSYNRTFGGTRYLSVDDALNYLFGVIYGMFPYPDCATTTDINQIFNS